MIRYKINEIKEGISTEVQELRESDFDTNGLLLKGGKLSIRFEKFESVIRASMTVAATVELLCDRSLEPYDAEVHGQYEIIFDASATEVIENERSTLKPLNEASNWIDLTNEVRETLLLSVPVKKLHPRFINEDGSETEFEQSFPEAEEQPDSRWDALKKLKNNN